MMDNKVEVETFILVAISIIFVTLAIGQLGHNPNALKSPQAGHLILFDNSSSNTTTVTSTTITTNSTTLSLNSSSVSTSAPSTTLNTTTTMLNITTTLNATTTTTVAPAITYAPLNVTLAPGTPRRLPIGVVSDISVVVTGGVAPYAYQWYEITPKSVATNPAANCKDQSAANSTCEFLPTERGTYYLGVRVTDSEGTVFNFDPDFIVTGLAANVSVIYNSGSALFNGTAYGGSGTYNMTWDINGLFVNGTNLNTCTLAQDNGNTTGSSLLLLTDGAGYQCLNGGSFNLTDGTYNVTFRAADALNLSDYNSSSAQLVIDWPSGIFNNTKISIGQSDTLVVAWEDTGFCAKDSHNPHTQSYCHSESLVWHPYNFTVNLYTSSSSSSCSPNSGILQTNSIFVPSTLSYGGNNYHNQSSFVVSPTSNTAYCAKVNYIVPTNETVVQTEATDAPATAKIIVTPVLKINLTANRTLISTGQSIRFSNKTTGGTGNNIYTYILNKTGGVTQNGNVFTFNTAGRFNVTLKVTDKSGEVNQSSVIITVTPPLEVTLIANRTQIVCCGYVLFTNKTTGGTGNVLYHYIVNNSNGVTQSGNKFKFADLGKYNVTLFVNDTSHEVNQSSVIISLNETLTVNGTKVLYPGNELTGIPTFSRGQTVNDLNLGPNGGIPPYTYEWTVALPGSSTYNPANCGPGASGPILSKIVPCLFTTNSSSPLGQYHFQLIVSDNESPPGVVYSAPEPFNLNASLHVIYFAANRSLISGDQLVSFVNQTVNGTGANKYNYTLISGPEGGKLINNGNGKYSFSTPGEYTIQINVVDISGELANATANVQVNATLETSLIANKTYISADQWVLFTNITTGGTGNRVFNYSVTNCTGYTRNGNKILFTTQENCLVTLKVHDQSGEFNESYADIVVTAPLVVTSFNANRTFISTGQLVSFTNTTKGGTGSNKYSYQVTANPPDAKYIENGNKFQFNTSGTYNVVLQVTDLSGEVNQSSIITINVTPPLEINLTANKTYISVDQLVKFTNTTKGGTGNNQYNYSLECEGGGPVEHGNIFNFTQQGGCYVTEHVKDTSGEVNQSNVTITITPPLVVTLHANRTLISTGQSVLFTNTTSGGTGSNVYSYTFNNPSGITQNGNKLQFNTSGYFNVTIHVTDKSGEVNQSSILINVTKPLVITSFIANRTLISVDQLVSFTNTTSGGTGNNQYTYATSCEASVYPHNKIIFLSADSNCIVTLKVSDASGEVNQSSISINVTPPLEINLAANKTSISVDQLVKFTNTTKGGTGNNQYNYSLECDGGGPVEHGNIFNFTQQGGCYVTEHVKDISGEVNQSTVEIIVVHVLTVKLYANWTYISAGQSVLFTNTTSGGTGSNVYSYTFNNPSGITQNGNKLQFNTSGYFNVTLHVTDKSGEVNQSSILINVTKPLVVTLHANRTLISTGQSVLFTNTTSGGTGDNIYWYEINGAGITSLPGFNYTATTDASPFYRSTSPIVSKPVTEIPNGDGSVTLNIAYDSNYADSGFYYNAGALGSLITGHVQIMGTSPMAVNLWINPQDWTWSGNIFTSLGTDGAYGLGTSSGTATISSTYKFYITAAASGSCLNGHTGQTLTVSQIEAYCSASTPIDLWVGIASTKAAASATVYSILSTESGNKFTFNQSGAYNVTLHVTDQSGEVNQSSILVNVTPPLEINLTANKTYISVDQLVKFTNTTKGGTGNNQYNYSLDCEGGGPVEHGNIFNFTQQGGCYVTEHVKDISGEVNQSNVTITITPPLVVTLHANRTLISTGQSVLFTNTTSGGTGSNVYSYTFNNPSGITQNGNKLQFNTSGYFNVTLHVTDKSGEVNQSSVIITVTPPLEVTLIANRTLISAGQSVTFTNKTTGGTGSNVYYYTTDPEECGHQIRETSNNFTFPNAGTCKVILHVSDATGEVNQSNVSITVTPPLQITSFTNTTTAYISDGQSVTFSNTTTGGTGHNVWTYLVNGVPTPPNYDNTFVFHTSGGDAVSSPGFISNLTPPVGAVPVVNFTYDVVNDEDSGNVGYWAMDTYVKHVSIWRETNGTYFAIATYNGTFSVPAGALSPGSGVPEAINGTGTFKGGYALEIIGTYNASALSHLKPVYDYGGTVSDLLKDTYGAQSGDSHPFNFIHYFFGSGAVYNYVNNGNDWGWNYAYCGQQWSNTGIHGSAGDVVTGKCGVYNVSLNVTDISGEFANSTNVIVRVTPALETSLIANKTLISAGQSVFFANYTNGGTGDNKYNYSLDCEGGGPVEHGNIFNFNETGTCKVTEHVKDISGEVNQSNVTITITPPLVVTLHANRTLISTGQSVLFTNTTSGGTGANKYSYILQPEGCGAIQNETNGNIWEFQYSLKCNVTIHVSDLSGEVNQSSIIINVTPPLKFTSFNVTTPISIDQAAIFTNTTTGGTGHNVFAYHLVSGPGNIIYQGYNKFKFSATGNYVIRLNVTDISGEINQSFVTVQVNPELGVNPLPSPINIDQNQNYTFTANAFNGTKPYSYSWTVNGLKIKSGCSSGTACVVTGNTTGNGFTVTLHVTDASKGVPQENVTTTSVINVHPPLGVKPPTSSHSLVDQGQSSVESSSVVGGTPPYTTYWKWELPANLSYVNITGSLQISDSVITQVLFPTSANTPIGDWEFQVFVLDSSNALPEMANAINQEGVTVYPQLLAYASASPNAIIGGNSSTLTGSTTGGSNPSNFVCQWFSEKPGSPTYSSISGATSCNTYIFNTTPSTTMGTWSFKMQVTDTGTTVYETVNSTVATVTVGSFGVTLTGSSAEIDSGQQESLTATLSGGVAPYSLIWNGPGTGICPTSTSNLIVTCPLTLTANVPKHDAFSVNAMDSASHTASGAFDVEVNPQPTATFVPLLPVLDSGQIETYIIKDSGGTGPFLVKLFNVTSGTPVYTGYSTTILSPGATGGISFEVSSNTYNAMYSYNSVLTDQGVTPEYVFNTISNTITVNPGLGSSITVVPQSISTGQNTLITASISGGTGPYTYFFNITNSTGSVVFSYSNTTPAKSAFASFVAGSNSVGKDTVSVKVWDTEMGYHPYNPNVTCNAVNACEILPPNTLTVNASSGNNGGGNNTQVIGSGGGGGGGGNNNQVIGSGGGGGGGGPTGPTIIYATNATSACFQIYNYSPPFTAVLNFTNPYAQFTLVNNYIFLNGSGVTVNGVQFDLTKMHQFVFVENLSNYTYTMALMNLSWVPAQHTIVVYFCRAPIAHSQQNQANTTTTVAVIQPTTLAPPSTSASTSVVVSNSSGNKAQEQAQGANANTLYAVAALALILLLLLSMLFLRSRKHKGNGKGTGAKTHQKWQ